jgi:phage-related protein (TIGR01555 family)
MGIIENLVSLARVLRSDGRRVDAWTNTVTGMGTSRDKRYYGAYQADPIIPDPTLEAMFNGDGIAARIVSLLVEDALAKGVGFTIQTDEDDDEDLTENQQIEADVIGAYDELGVVKAAKEARIWSRLFGGGAILPILDTPGSVLDPLDYSTIRKVRSLVVLDKRSLSTSQELVDSDVRSPTFGQPKYYRIQKTDARQIDFQLIHASRLIRFDGALTTERTKQTNQGWSLSVLQRLYEPLRDFHGGYGNVGQMLAEGSVGIFKMRGLIEALSSKDDSLMAARFQAMDLAKSVTRSILLDASTTDGAEDYRREQITFNNVPDVLDRFAQRVAACEGMPLTVLLGISPAGLNSTGESDLINWEKRVKSEQTDNLKPQLEQLTRMILSSSEGPTRGKVPDNWSVIFPAIREMTEEQVAELRSKVATTDGAYIDKGVVTPEQVAVSRFGKKGWSMETKVDLELVNAEMERDKDEALEAMRNPPVGPVEPLPKVE